MRRNVRLALLAVALVLCFFANLASPLNAGLLFCGPHPPSCSADHDCDAYCQPCAAVGVCEFPLRDPSAPGFCDCFRR
jgi:hypothetical protein